MAAEEELKHFLANGAETAPAPVEALEWAEETRAVMVDLKFCDLFGAWQHMTLPIGAFGKSAFDEGLGFDGSSIRGWQGIEESDMLLMPDPATAILDPFTEAPTLSLICEVLDPVTREPYARDPRRVARRAEEYLRSTAIADTACFGPECEFFVLDEVSVRTEPTTSSTRQRDTGTPGCRGSATRSGRRRGTSRRRRTTRCTTSERGWC
jgi:glutamine synthetase